MKRVVSISLGSSERNHKVNTVMGSEEFEIERIGTDGSISSMIDTIKELDGKVDAFGLGGIDLYLFAGEKRYTLHDAKKIVANAKLTPIVDGSGLKNTLERRTLEYLNDQGWDFSDKKVLMVCAMDRFGMAQTFEKFKANMVYGDLVFTLGIPVKIRSLKTLYKIAKIVMPVIKYLPFKLFYPTGNKQETQIKKHKELFKWADIIAGDYHYIKRFMPEDLSNKIIITNTVTSKDIEVLKSKNAGYLVTSTPELNGRSFGTNVMEAVLVAMSGEKELSVKQYEDLLHKVNFLPRIVKLDQEDRRRDLLHG
ncbi:quinate 5-dehydrogenase [Alkalicella caledoniensis]|uniref:Quinate 5-dehydrogenase n=1 Tax=Alkalicella caledoniensis TaxID=2731377 RepID=A0A7G9W823_ALKCA|nr:quinate 5-dehydrogenase [Alkalicella caledoniensis]QNO14835.1 quinate 5-dehydrogenase [Alkalicella caledoniensis]